MFLEAEKQEEQERYLESKLRVVGAGYRQVRGQALCGGAAVDVDNPQSQTLAAIGGLRKTGSCSWPPPFKQQSSRTAPQS